jgi:hypothetical protein
MPILDQRRVTDGVASGSIISAGLAKEERRHPLVIALLADALEVTALDARSYKFNRFHQVLGGPAQKFMDYANMTPAQRLQAEMMSQLGITEDQFKAMSPADQAKVMDKIRDMIKQQAQNTGDQRTGLLTDISA